MKRLWRATKRAVSDFGNDEAMTLAAALAFYTMLSLAPLLLIAIWVASLVWGRGAEDEAASRAAEVVGPQGAEVIRTVLSNASKPSASRIAAIVGFATLLFSASGVFAQLQFSLNKIWKVKPRPDAGVTSWLTKRLWTLVMVAGIGLVLLASLIVSAVLSGLQGHLRDIIDSRAFWLTLNTVVPFLLFVLLFAMIYKILPDVKVPWSDVWIGAFLTAVLFAVGRHLIGWYIGKGGTSSVYGAAGSLVALLIWLYYSAVIFFFGAEMTQAYTREDGSPIQPSNHATWTEDRPPPAPR